MDIRIFAPEEMIETEITLPLSKSMSNRALLMKVLTPDAEPLTGIAECDDSTVMRRALECGPTGPINVGAAGTAMRFLSAYYAAVPGTDIVIDGSERMRQRPITPLVDALRQAGADIQYVDKEGYPPLHIIGKRLEGGDLQIDATVSSQFISALLMVAPTFKADTTLTLMGEPSSLPYIDMTIAMMQHRGIDVEREHDEIKVHSGSYRQPQTSDIERDWSAASYWYEIAALSAGWITLPGLVYPSLQGDSRLAELFEKLGVITDDSEDGEGVSLSASPEVFSRLDADLSDCPDIVQTLVVTCCMIGVPFTFTGVSSLRVKETDRLEALKRELVKVGCILEIERDDTIKWEGRRMPVNQLPEFDTYEDHRMAMALAPASLYASGMVIKNCEVVSKSYPTFWSDMQHAGFIITDASMPIQTADA